MNTLVTYQLKDSIATISMDDGKVNVLSLRMQAELNAALDRAAADRATIVLTGKPGVFCAGFDLPVLTAGGPDSLNMLIGGFKLAERLLSHPAPVVIACGGHAVAMGVFLLLADDYRIGADGAFKIVANEVAIGMTLPHSAIEICRQRLAPAHFQRATINAELYMPADAVAAGFLDRVVPAADLQGEALAAAAKLAKLNMPAHAATKLRVRGQALAAIRAAIEADHTEYRALATPRPR
jgi:enoyl-CoA hydratase